LVRDAAAQGYVLKSQAARSYGIRENLGGEPEALVCFRFPVPVPMETPRSYSTNYSAVHCKGENQGCLLSDS
jgi:hypothetical protein